MNQLLPHKALQAKAGILRDKIKQFEDEYRWAIGGAYQKDVTESEKVSGGGTSNPTLTVAAGMTYESKRSLIKSALRQFDEAGLCLDSAIGLLLTSQPKSRGARKILPNSPREGIFEASSKDGKEQTIHFQKIKAKREASGGGYGDH